MGKTITVVDLDAGYPVIEVVFERPYHRHVVEPDADLSAEDADVQAIAGTVFTDVAKAVYAAAQVEVV